MGRQWTATQPRARVPVCWVCDRQLYAGGKTYTVFIDQAGHERPVHKACEEGAERDGLERKEDKPAK